MADRRITQLIETANPSTNAVLPIVNSNNRTERVTLDNFVRASSWSLYNVNTLDFKITDSSQPLDNDLVIPVQSPTDLSLNKITIGNLLPRPVNASSTISITFNSSTRAIDASLNSNSIQPFHFSTECIYASAIAPGTITTDKIDPTIKLAGATGGGDDRVFFENDVTITTSYTITQNKNAMTAGPVTINPGITITVPTGSTWTVV